MSSDGSWSNIGIVIDRWSALERDWKSVVVGGAIVVLGMAFELQIPW
ncbi:hypothetical protein [Natrinema halophilum]|uniref:Uncharacterized protein n=1 Tax=Natrinema halophilum TaxID=1699371 RepID=A0A7D5GSL0_9EURY|nr:hypothetical protein [Natrinema halophilum]QLG49389.1 hypothetical protein HYG82_11200 [Natrinema halophilum]